MATSSLPLFKGPYTSICCFRMTTHYEYICHLLNNIIKRSMVKDTTDQKPVMSHPDQIKQ